MSGRLLGWICTTGTSLVSGRKQTSQSSAVILAEIAVKVEVILAATADLIFVHNAPPRPLRLLFPPASRRSDIKSPSQLCRRSGSKWKGCLSRIRTLLSTGSRRRLGNRIAAVSGHRPLHVLSSSWEDQSSPTSRFCSTSASAGSGHPHRGSRPSREAPLWQTDDRVQECWYPWCPWCEETAASRRGGGRGAAGTRQRLSAPWTDEYAARGWSSAKGRQSSVETWFAECHQRPSREGSVFKRFFTPWVLLSTKF